MSDPVSQPETANLNETSGIGVDTNDMEFENSSNEDTENYMMDVVAEQLNQSRIGDETPKRPKMNSTCPAEEVIDLSIQNQENLQNDSPRPDVNQNAPSKPRKLTKGSRASSFRPEGINLNESGAWEEGREAQDYQHASCMDENDENDWSQYDLLMDDLIEDSIFIEEDPSFEEIPSLEHD